MKYSSQSSENEGTTAWIYVITRRQPRSSKSHNTTCPPGHVNHLQRTIRQNAFQKPVMTSRKLSVCSRSRSRISRLNWRKPTPRKTNSWTYSKLSKPERLHYHRRRSQVFGRGRQADRRISETMKQIEIPTLRYSNIVWIDSDNPKYKQMPPVIYQSSIDRHP